VARALRDAAQAPSTPGNPVERNVAAIAKVEDAARRVRTPTERTVDAIAQFLGRPLFLSVQVVWMGAWISWNVLAPHRAFDRPPFYLLDSVLSVEAIVISTFVLISQNRMSAADTRREQLNLQVNLLAEAEMTSALNLLHRISQHLRLPDTAGDAEARELATRTDIAEVARHVDEQLAPEPTPMFTVGKTTTGRRSSREP
jgi:uncharacterized membrane protein